MAVTKNPLRREVQKLAEDAFHLNLISGYGDSEYSNEYQIVYQGKPRHLPLEEARSFLLNLIQKDSSPDFSFKALSSELEYWN